jgi:DNA polymerase
MTSNTTPFKRHSARWKNCRKCSLCERRSKVVIARGRVPAEILFVGEAPGQSEDVIGLPFVGPAGKLLDEIIDQGLDGQYDYAITNLVCCIPLDENGSKVTEPPREAIMACDERLQEFVVMVDPRLFVCVGSLAQKWLSKNLGSEHHDEVVSIVHPAAILRMDVSQRGLAIQRAVVTLQDAVEEL